MARMQRWRRGRSAGEDTTSAADPSPGTQEVAATVEDDDLHEAGPEAADDEEAAPDVEEPDVEEPDVEEPDVEEPELDADAPDVEEIAPQPSRDAEDDDLEATEPPLLPSAKPSGVTGWLFDGNPGDAMVFQLIRAAHAKQAVMTALAMGLAALVAGRAAREVGVVLLTVLIGQAVLGWVNDIIDRRRDIAHEVKGKPLANGKLTTEAVWYSIAVGICLLVPMAVTSGIKAGCIYLASVAVGVLGNVLLRTGFFSWWSWAVSFALLPVYLSYGGWGGQAEGHAPEIVIVVLAGLLGIGVHFMRAVWGLVADHEDGWTYLPLKLGLKLGATRLLALATVYTTVIVVLIAIAGAKVGLSQ